MVPRPHPEIINILAGFRFVPLGRVGRALPTVPVLGSQVRAHETAAQQPHRNGADLTPEVRRCTHRADDATEGNGPPPPHQPPPAPHDPATLGNAAQFPEGAEAPAGGACSSQLLTLT